MDYRNHEKKTDCYQGTPRPGEAPDEVLISTRLSLTIYL